MKICVLSAINGNHQSRIIWDYFFTWHFDALCITQKPVIYNSRVK